MNKNQTENAKKIILDFLKVDAARPMSLRDLVKSLGVPPGERDGFKRFLSEMVESGELMKIRSGRYSIASRLNLVTGTLTCHPDGFGFVVPEGDGKETDVFINPRRLAGAMHGDKVAARVEGYKSGDRREGRIIRILARAHKTIIGRFERSKGYGVVVPSDVRVLDRVIIPEAGTGGIPDSVMVEVELTRWPAKNRPPAGRVLRVIGDPDDPGVEAEVILGKFGLPATFPAGVLKEAEAVARPVTAGDIRGRKDLRDRLTFTIDGETAKDFDDAVSIERVKGGFRLYVSIADVSSYVKAGSGLDAEAFSRSTSVYFPDRCIPMLPEALSNGICSLVPGLDRLAMTAELDFDSSGTPVKAVFYESVIKSDERLTYTTVSKLLSPSPSDEERALESRYSRVLGDLKIMEELARKLNANRLADGSLDFDLPEPQIIIDISGVIEDIVRSERNIAHRIIEEFMLAANRAVAREFSRKKLPFIYRVHDPPDPEKLNDFKEFVAGFGLKLGHGPLAFAKLLKKVEGRPEEKLVNHVLLRSMKQAVYSPERSVHFGLAFEDYTHFTSPIRRYPDLVVHRLLKLLVLKGYNKRERDRARNTLPDIALSTSRAERKAMEAEREIVDLKKAQFMKSREGEEFDGLVSGVTSFGLFVELNEYFVECLVHVSTLADDYYLFDERTHTLTGERAGRSFRIGDPVRVVIGRADLERRRIDAMLAEVVEGARGPRLSRSHRGKGKGGPKVVSAGKAGRAAKGGKAGKGAKAGRTGKAGKGGGPKSAAGRRRPGKKRGLF